jgi:uncharacterized protein YndB with AHSA1/START domain
MAAVLRSSYLDEPSPYAFQRAAELTGTPLVLARAGRFGAEPDELFRFISDFERLPAWMPMIKRCRVDNRRASVPGGVGAVRLIDAGVGRPTEETVIAFEPPTLLAYSASDASLRGLFTGHVGVLVSEPHPAGGSRLSWLSHARPGTGPQRLLGPGVLAWVVQRSLAGLARQFPLSRRGS